MKTIIMFFLILLFNGCAVYIVKDCPCPKLTNYVWNYGQYIGDTYPKWRYEPIDTIDIDIDDDDSLKHKLPDGIYH